VKRHKLANLVFLFVFILLAVLLLSGLPKIPFHPDEVSLLYQSRDFELIFTEPSVLPYRQSREGEVDQTYRALNPSFPKYILALGRRAAGYGAEAVSIDWNWSLTWDENNEAGALLDSKLLTGARTASTVMVILSLPILYLCGKHLKNHTLGIMIALILGTHALVLLHGRRAMAEGTLIFAVCLAILGFFEGDKRPWLAGLGTALAACTKMSAAVLAPVGLLSVLWLHPMVKNQQRKRVQNVIIFLAVFLLVYFLFTPLLWSNPIQAVQAQWQERTQFLERMVEEIEAIAPNQILRSPLERFGAMTAHLFMSQPQFAEVGNYTTNTAQAEEIYLSSFYHSLFRGLIGGGLLCTLILLGMINLGIEIRQEGWNAKRPMVLLLIGTLVQSIALLWANPLPFQRYYLPLIPFITIWISYGITSIVQRIKQATSKRSSLL
jgi:4-amino-4-deoxy-L-arabinose transferase-like glycosyltransferase